MNHLYKRCLKEHNISPPVIKAIENFYIEKGIEPLVCSMNVTLTEHAVIVGERVMQITNWHEPHLVEGLSSYHRLMQSSPRDELVSCLTRFKPGTVLADKEGNFWIRRARMVITRHRFISSVGDDQEQYYQKYLLQVPLTDEDEVVLDPLVMDRTVCQGGNV